MGGRREVSIIFYRPVTRSDLKRERSFFRGSVSSSLQLVLARTCGKNEWQAVKLTFFAPCSIPPPSLPPPLPHRFLAYLREHERKPHQQNSLHRRLATRKKKLAATTSLSWRSLNPPRFFYFRRSA